MARHYPPGLRACRTALSSEPEFARESPRPSPSVANKGTGALQESSLLTWTDSAIGGATFMLELNRVFDRDGRPLTAMVRRVPAVDARGLLPRTQKEVAPFYSLADQLFVDPHPLLPNDGSQTQQIEMTLQEIAVAQSHIEVWKLVASGQCPYALVLEDDVYLRRNFARTLDRAWADLYALGGSAELLYVSYKEVTAKPTRQAVSRSLFKPAPGLWQLSGYVLSKKGAQKLLERLPVRGPVDLWINHQFQQLEVLATVTPLIRQRRDLPSGNSYSILPILSKVGVLTRERPSLFNAPRLPHPVFAFGDPDSRLSPH